MNRTLRISRQEWAIGMAVVTAKRSTCLRRQVGCVLLDRDGYVLSTGVNGVPSGFAHCNQPRDLGRLEVVGENEARAVFPYACPGAFAASGTNLDGCHAVHAENNALLRCRDPREIDECYVTHSPCIGCVKLLLNTACQKVYFLEAYAHDEAAQQLWHEKRAEGTWINLTPELLDRINTMNIRRGK